MKKFSFGHFVAVVLIRTGLASTGIVWYVNQLTHKLETETILILKEFAAQDVRHVEMQISKDLDLLYAIATSLGMYPNMTKQELIAFLQAQREQNHYKNLEFAQPDGTTTLDDGSFLELSKTHHFQEAIKGAVNISNRGQDILDRSNILVEAAPVKQNGEIIGVLMGTRNTADFAKLLDMQSFNGMGYSLLVRANGDKVVESFHKNAISGLYNIFDMPDDPDHALRHQVLSDFTARKSGVITYHSAKRGMLYISYQPLSVNDWYLISVVPASHITKVTNTFITLLPALCLLIALAALMLGAYLRYIWPNLRQHFSSAEAK